ncbi:PilW family protein [Candidatus Omnitrophota bacterium]
MKAFTLLEVLVSLLIFSFLIAAIFVILNVSDMTYSNDLGLLDLHQQARFAMDGMVRELRRSKDSRISVVSVSEINFYISPETYGSDWIGPIRYYWDANQNQIIREYPTGTTKIIAQDISGLSFSLNSDLLDIQLTSAKIVRQRNLSFALAGQVRFRNE